MPPSNLTEHLLNLKSSDFDKATKHPFLSKAGEGTLSQNRLCQWLVQDKYYQFGYVNFIGRLISKLDLTPYAFPANGGEENLQWKTLNALIAAVQAIKSEIDFYNKVVQKYDLQLEKVGPNEVTQKYVDLFTKSSGESKPLVWGLAVLWATEYCYLKAWTFAKEHKTSLPASESGKGAIAALHEGFVPNWTSDEFKGAVDALAGILNEWGQRASQAEVSECESLWRLVLELEAQFWPDVS